MNKVSWRRILQRAGHEFPSDGGAAVVQMREPGGRGNFAPPQGRNDGSGVLESELQRALNRAARRDQDKSVNTPPGWEPIFMAQELSARPTQAPAASPKRKPVPAAPQKRASSGTRNILAISLSAAVVGIAIQQIGTQWNDGREASVPETSTASLLYAGTRASEPRQAFGAEPRDPDPHPLDMRPSLTQDAPSLDTSTLKERDDFMREIEEASNILRSKEAAQKRKDGSSVTPVVAPIPRGGTTDLEPSAISGSEEQAMLRRARELMERGHITGARLIFEHLALQQSALGAFALAQTYDEKFLNTFFVKGLRPDQKLAAKWYRRAAELAEDTPDRR